MFLNAKKVTNIHEKGTNLSPVDRWYQAAIWDCSWILELLIIRPGLRVDLDYTLALIGRQKYPSVGCALLVAVSRKLSK